MDITLPTLPDEYCHISVRDRGRTVWSIRERDHDNKCSLSLLRCWNWNMETRKSFNQHHLNALLGFKLFHVLSQFLMTLQIFNFSIGMENPVILSFNSYHDTTMGRICCRSEEMFHHHNPAVGYVLAHTPTNIPPDPSFTSASISLTFHHYHY